jgi:hypothetical protein
MAEIARSSDFTKLEGDPGARAGVDRELEQLEQCDVDAALPGGKLKFVTRTRAASVLICSVAVLVLTLSGGTIAGIAKAAGVSGWPVVVTALVTPAAYCTLAFLILIYVLSHQNRHRSLRDTFNGLLLMGQGRLSRVPVAVTSAVITPRCPALGRASGL